MTNSMLKVRDKVFIVSSNGVVLAEGEIVSINNYREPSMKYAVSVDGFDDFLFVGEENLRKIGGGLNSKGHKCK